uniref:Protein PLASTID REDOX INSENSITIVE 2, chloroplastic n=1 Tax=Noccaea caerulescens TaxID=107243 RepID=A0A1J3CBR5_NOCCA
MASLHEALFSSRIQFPSSSSSLRCALPTIHSLSSPAANSCAVKSTQFLKRSTRIRLTDFPLSSASRRGFVCRASEYKFPDPIPEFAEAETEKFREHMLKKLSKRDLFEDSVDEIVGICTEIFETFLRSEYGGPGTLLVVPFIDMADTLNERELPGGPQAARAAIKWAQDHVDKDWKEWTGTD